MKEKLTKTELIDALFKWVNNPEDFWLFRFIHSLGYSVREFAVLADSDEDIGRVGNMCVEAQFEKCIARIITGEMNAYAAFWAIKYLNAFLDKAMNEKEKYEHLLSAENSVSVKEDNSDYLENIGNE